jgi:hypothetical protein
VSGYGLDDLAIEVRSPAGVIRMDNNRTVKKVFNTKPIGVRKTGRPKVRWKDLWE